MKKLFLACALIFSLCTLGGCSKDDDSPSSKGKVKGNVKVDGKSFDVKYGFIYSDEDNIEYLFFDTNPIDNNGNYKNGERFSALYLLYNKDISNITSITISYNVRYNDPKEGCNYLYLYNDAYKYVTFSNQNGFIKSSCQAIKVEAYEYNTSNPQICEATFSVEGILTDLGRYNDKSRSIRLTEITDPYQLASLKSLSGE